MTPSEERAAIDRGDFLPFILALRELRHDLDEAHETIQSERELSHVRWNERNEARAAARWYHHGATDIAATTGRSKWPWLENDT